jgi:hypothetical protein
MNVTRTGKIARLPKAIRDELNRRLSDGEPGKDLVAWLNALPEVQRIVAEFGGRPVREQNLSEWKQGGYEDWLRQQEALELVHHLSAEAEDLQVAAGDPLSDKLGLLLVAQYAVGIRKLAGPKDGEVDWARLREMCSDVVALRRGDHSAARLKIEQARLDREREETEEEVVAHFQRWARNPTVRDLICGNCISLEERERRLRQIFGLPDPKPSEKHGLGQAILTTKEAGQELESSPIQPHQPGPPEGG